MTASESPAEMRGRHAPPAAGPSPGPSPFARHWSLDPGVTFLNHGSYGACPRPVLAAQQAWRDRLEAEPVRFIGELPGHLAVARTALAAFLGAAADDLAFVQNATTGVNAVLRSLRFRPGDEILVNNHEYNAVLNAVRFVAEREGATVVAATLPFPVRDPGAVARAILDAVTPRTRLAVISHVTSPTALVLPLAELVADLAGRGVDTLVDGAHAGGMLALDLDALGAAYYAGNCHKWICSPKGAGFLHVRRDRQPDIHPLTISHGANAVDPDRSRFRLEFDWTGTFDPSACLSVPDAIDFMGSLYPGGWPELMAGNRALALRGRDTIADALGVEVPAPDAMIGAMAAIPLPARSRRGTAPDLAAIAEALVANRIQVPVLQAPSAGPDEPPLQVVRISAQAYNSIDQYAALADVLVGAIDG